MSQSFRKYARSPQPLLRFSCARIKTEEALD
nr:MAG TPA: hypothetical protein [Caudoviricetes sp.]